MYGKLGMNPIEIPVTLVKKAWVMDQTIIKAHWRKSTWATKIRLCNSSPRYMLSWKMKTKSKVWFQKDL